MTTTQQQTITKTITTKYESLRTAGALNERSRRLWAATEARALGRGGMSLVVTATGLDYKTIRAGLTELDHPEQAAPPDTSGEWAVAESR